MREKGNFHTHFISFHTKHVEMINFILKTLREKADFFCHKYFVMVNSYCFEITLLYRLTRIFDSFGLFLPQNYTDKNTAV